MRIKKKSVYIYTIGLCVASYAVYAPDGMFEIPSMHSEQQQDVQSRTQYLHVTDRSSPDGALSGDSGRSSAFSNRHARFLHVSGSGTAQAEDPIFVAVSPDSGSDDRDDEGVTAIRDEVGRTAAWRQKRKDIERQIKREQSDDEEEKVLPLDEMQAEYEALAMRSYNRLKDLDPKTMSEAEIKSLGKTIAYLGAFKGEAAKLAASETEPQEQVKIADFKQMVIAQRKELMKLQDSAETWKAKNVQEKDQEKILIVIP